MRIRTIVNYENQIYISSSVWKDPLFALKFGGKYGFRHLDDIKDKNLYDSLINIIENLGIDKYTIVDLDIMVEK